ncbi:hypothetical protein [Kitasatospora sp. NPDC093806]|uniref:hypothetical protein n=1 Tax=Kitasatospora sp. NPDC093806 TaxID=3155075 RepID=UPI0034267132
MADQDTTTSIEAEESHASCCAALDEWREAAATRAAAAAEAPDGPADEITPAC